MAVVVLDVSYSLDIVFSSVLLVDSVTKGKILLCNLRSDRILASLLFTLTGSLAKIGV